MLARRRSALVAAAILLFAGCGGSGDEVVRLAAVTPAAPTSTAAATTAPVALPPAGPTPIDLPTPAPATSVPAPVEAAGEDEIPATAVPTQPADPTPAAEPTSAATPTPAAPSTPEPALPADNAAVAIANGGEVYGINCARCHAESGLGTFQGPGLIGVAATYSRAGLINELTNGHPVTFGFADKLSADEIASVVAYVRATF